ncbi:MAG: bifunctional aldolase/short-chain dehydrogenase [Candidatus Aquiluna sp.]|nr:bifunctional aldolase/short-chain dehydrogenase [Aquiluna sp.]
MAAKSIAQQLIERSNRLGSNPKNTNFAGGNTSAKGAAIDPVSGEQVAILWVKGSGGDLGTLTQDGLAVLRLDAARNLKKVYRGASHDDEMMAIFDYCLFGTGGGTPSIDTAMHALVEKSHVDHLHPDSGIAIATSSDARELTKKIFGDRVLFVPWRRPGFQLGLDISRLQKENPQAIGCILGGHGITAWGDTSKEAERNSLEIISTAERYIKKHSKAKPFGPRVAKFSPLPKPKRLSLAADLAPLIRGLASTDKPMVGHFSDDPRVLEFLSSKKMLDLSQLGTSCPDHFLRTKVRPMVLNAPPDLPLDRLRKKLTEAHAEYRASYAAYYKKYAKRGSPKMRGADPAIVLVPGIGMFSFGANKQTARVAAEFYLNAINVMRGAEGISSYQPITESEKFAIEYWDLEEAKLQRMPKPKPLSSRVALITGGASGIGKAITERLVQEGACVVIADLNLSAAQELATQLGGPDVAVAAAVNVVDEKSIRDAIKLAALSFGGVDLVVNNAGLSLSKSLLETTEQDWDLQHDVMAKGSFLVSRETAKLMIDQGLGGDIIYISSKNSVFAGPNNIAYGATKADQAHQVRLLAAELGAHGIRVNGINPDGVVRGSGIFAGGWGASRAKVYGVKEQDLGRFYAQRTILKKEVLPEHVANAVIALTAGELSHTTGLHIPVDAGVAAAFLR